MAWILNYWKVFSMVNVMDRHPWQMKAPAVIVFAICVVGLLSFSHADAARDGSVVPGSLTAAAIGKVDDSVLKNDGVGQAPTIPPALSTPSNIFRDIPSISGDYWGGRTKLMPYIGAGFGSGYMSDLDRSVSGGPSTQTDSGSRSHVGQGLTPSEFQIGIRIPF